MTSSRCNNDYYQHFGKRCHHKQIKYILIYWSVWKRHCIIKDLFNQIVYKPPNIPRHILSFILYFIRCSLAERPGGDFPFCVHQRWTCPLPLGCEDGIWNLLQKTRVLWRMSLQSLVAGSVLTLVYSSMSARLRGHSWSSGSPRTHQLLGIYSMCWMSIFSLSFLSTHF